MLEDFNDYSCDDAIDFLADIMQLIAAQFPELTPLEMKQDKSGVTKSYSKRTKLWKVPQDNAFFRGSFNQHARAQREASKLGDTATASLESKLKTKECRFSLAVDVLMKGFEQKARLDLYKEQALTEAMAAGRHDVAEVLEGSSIMAIRQRVIDKAEAAEAKVIGLPYWPRAVTKESAEVGHMLSMFLCENNKILRSGCAKLRIQGGINLFWCPVLRFRPVLRNETKKGPQSIPKGCIF